MRRLLSCVVLLLAALPLTGLAAQEAGPATRPRSSSVGRTSGTRAPEFSLPWANKDGVGGADSPYELWRDRGKTVVLAFYPADFTNGCTAEMQTFADQYDTLFGPDVVVWAVNADSLETHKRFAASLDLPFRLLSDPDLTGGPQVRQQRRRGQRQADGLRDRAGRPGARTGT